MDEVTIKMSRAMAETAALVLASNGCNRAARQVIAALRCAESDESEVGGGREATDSALVRRLCDGAEAGKLDRMIEDAERLCDSTV